jgi:hypothetical protein
MMAAPNRPPADIDLGMVRFRFVAAPLAYRPWAAMQARMAPPMRRKPGWRKLTALWLVICLGVLAALVAEDRWLGLDATLVIIATRHDDWFWEFGGSGVAALALGPPLAVIAALVVITTIYREPFMRRFYAGFPALQQSSELFMGENGIAHKSATGTVLFARWPTVIDEFMAEGVWFIRLSMGTARYVGEAALGDQRAAAMAFMRKRLAAPDVAADAPAAVS